MWWLMALNAAKGMMGSKGGQKEEEPGFDYKTLPPISSGASSGPSSFSGPSFGSYEQPSSFGGYEDHMDQMKKKNGMMGSFGGGY